VLKKNFTTKGSRTRAIHTTDKAQTTASLEALVLATKKENRAARARARRGERRSIGAEWESPPLLGRPHPPGGRPSASWPDGAIVDWRSMTPVGQALVAAFSHVLILSLHRSADRRRHMRLVLGGLGLSEGDHYAFVHAVDCSASYGSRRFQQQVSLAGNPRAMNASGQQLVPWMRPPCNGTWRPWCTSAEYRQCHGPLPSDAASRHCGEVCYTLSVARALQRFLHGNQSRVLILEDDVCPTQHLHQSASLLRQVERSHWHVLKMGHCLHQRRGLVVDEPDCDATRSTSATPSLLEGLGQSFCAHAIGLSRFGAQALLRLTVPVSAVFDDVIASLSGTFGERQQRLAARAAGLSSARLLRAKSTSVSLFGQLSRARGGGDAFPSTIDTRREHFGAVANQRDQRISAPVAVEDRPVN